MKRALALLLTIALIFGVLPVQSYAANVTTMKGIPQSTTAAISFLESNVGAINGKYLIPGLMQTVTFTAANDSAVLCTSMTPQAMTFAGNGAYLLISAYCNCGSSHRSVLYLLDGSSKEYLSTLVLDSTMHAGGIAWEGDNIWVADTVGGASTMRAYRYSDALLAIDHNYRRIYTVASQTIDTSPSYLCYSNGYLYAGTFSETNANSTIYFYSVNGTKLTKAGSFGILGIPKVQGISIRNGAMVITASYGRTNPSDVYVFSDVYNRFRTSGVNYTAAGAKHFTFANMVEGCYIGSSYTYFLFESGAKTYRESANTRPLDRYVRFSHALLGIEAAAASTYSVIGDGTYTISPVGNTNFNVQIRNHATYVDAEGEIGEACDDESQKFILQRSGTDTFTIRNLHSGLFLQEGANNKLVQCGESGKEEQLWYLISNGSSYSIVSKTSGRYLDLSNNDLKTGTDVQTWVSNNSDAQRWVLRPVQTLPDGYYSIFAMEDDDYCWDISNGSADNNANLAVYTKNGTDAQSFYISYQTNGYYTIRAKHSGKYVDVHNAECANGTNLAQYQFNGTNSQYWQIVPNLNGTYSFVSKCNGLYIDMNGGGFPFNNKNLQCYSGNKSSAQCWYVRHVHDYVASAVAPTCEDEGGTRYTCSICLDSYLANPVAALGHAWDGGSISQAPNCSTEGIRTFTCTRCAATKNEFLDRTAHTPLTDPAKAPTCKLSGLTEGSHCGVCGEIIDPQTTIAALGHLWNDGTISRQPNCQQNGVIVFTCSRCKDTKTELLPKGDHNEVPLPAKAATCTEDGKTEGSKCSACGMIICEQETIPALGHDYQNGVCTRCHDAQGIVLKFHSANLSLQSSISIHFLVEDALLQGLRNVRVQFVKDGEAAQFVSNYTTLAAADGTICRVYTLKNVYSPQMSQNVTATIFAEKNGVALQSAPKTYSVCQYALNLLSNPSTNDYLRTLLVDLLNYGTASQEYFRYNTANPANASLSAAQLQFGTKTTPTLSSHSSQKPNAGGLIRFKSATLLLNENISINYYLDLSRYDGSLDDLSLRVTYADNAGRLHTTAVDGSTFQPKEAAPDKLYYVASFSALNPMQMRTICTAEVFSKSQDRCISYTFTYSIESYAANAAPELTKLVHAMLNYGDSVERYFSILNP